MGPTAERRGAASLGQRNPDHSLGSPSSAAVERPPLRAVICIVESDNTASFSALPPELVLLILSLALDHLSAPHQLLASFVRVNRACNALATPLLYANPCLTSVASLDTFLDTVAHGQGEDVRACRVEGRVFASKGWGVRVSRVLKACRRIERIEVVGIDDLRAKHLVGEGTVTHLSLLNSSFSPHSLPSPPSLGPFLSSLTHLTLANVGLPHPSTHLTDILALCAPHLEHLALSSLRDVEEYEFRRALAILVQRGHRLQSVKLGFLIEGQIRAMCAPLLSDALSNPPPSPSLPFASSRRPTSPPEPSSPAALSLLPALVHLTFTLPLPTSPLLCALPPTLEILTIRPPYSRPTSTTGDSADAPTIFGTSRTSLLRVLDRRPSPAVTPRAQTPTGTRAGAGLGHPRRPSFTLAQLEEEERVLLALESALCPPDEVGGPGAGVVAPRLREVRWEGRAMSSARGRVGDVLERRGRAGVGAAT